MERVRNFLLGDYSLEQENEYPPITCGFESKIVPTHVLIQGQRAQLHAHLDIYFLMDIVVVDIPVTYGVLLSRKWTTTMGGKMQMDLTYASIPNVNQELVTLYRSPFMRHFVEDPSDSCYAVMNETFCQLF